MFKAGIFLLITIVIFISYGFPYEHGSAPFQVYKIFEKKLDGEENAMSVRAIDFRRKNSKNAIAVSGKKLYIFNGRGAPLFESREDVFSQETLQMNVAKLSKDGYYNSIIISNGKNSKVFDSLGMQLSTLRRGPRNFLVKDMNGDGVDEMIVGNEAFHTEDGGFTWKTLWRNKALTGFCDDLQNWGNEGGFCTSAYNSLQARAVDRDGKVIFATTIPTIKGGGGRCLSAGDFTGDGIKNNIVMPTGRFNTCILSASGSAIKVIPHEYNGKVIDIDQPMQVAVGQLIYDNDTDEVVVSGRRGLIAYDAQGNTLWTYIKWAGQGGSSTIDNLYLADLDGDGSNEVVVGKGKTMLILSDRGELIHKEVLVGDLSRWRSNNPAVDVADINGDGYKEIIIATDKGWLYIFGISK